MDNNEMNNISLNKDTSGDQTVNNAQPDFNNSQNFAGQTNYSNQNDFNSQNYNNQNYNNNYNNGYSQSYSEQPIPVPVPMNMNMNADSEPVIGIGEWLVSLLLMIIPCVNIIMMFVFAFSGKRQTKKNFFRAYLILTAILVVLELIFISVFGAALAAALSEMGAYY